MAAAARGMFSLNLLRTNLTASSRLPYLPTCTHIQQMNYAKPLGLGRRGKGKIGPTVEKVRLPVETDPEKLVKFVCGSHPVKEERQDIELKDDSEYPDWLWELRTGKPLPLEELDPQTKYYWRRVRTMGMKADNLNRKLKKF